MSDPPPNEQHDHSGPVCPMCEKASRAAEAHVVRAHGATHRLCIDNALDALIHCGRCTKERPKSIAMRDWARLNVGFTEVGLQIWCVRHDINVLSIDFQGAQHPASSMTHPPKASPPPPLVHGGFDGPVTERELWDAIAVLDAHAERAGQDDGALAQCHRIASRAIPALLSEQYAKGGNARARAAALLGVDGARHFEAMERRLEHMPIVPQEPIAEEGTMAPVLLQGLMRLQSAAIEAQAIARDLFRMIRGVLEEGSRRGA